MVSNDVAALAAGETCYATVLNRKGRLLSDLVVLALEDALLLDTAAGTAPEVLRVLERHVIADDVTLEDLSETWGHVALEGPGVRALLQQRGLPVREPGHFELYERDGETILCLAGGSLTEEGTQLLGPRKTLARLADEIGLAALSESEADVLRIEAFLPSYGVDMTDRNFPNEARLDRAISYTKGCYLGQEIIARIESRGAVNRFLSQIRTEAPVKRGDPIRVGGSRVGEITSAAVSSVTGPVALGYVRAAEAEPGTPLDVAGVPGVVSGPL
jgi:aminomethyltransferase